MVQQISPDTQVLKIIANADPKFKYIPATLINFAMRNVCGVFLNLVERKSQNLTEEYLRLIEEKQEFYDQVRAKCARTIQTTKPPNL